MVQILQESSNWQISSRISYCLCIQLVWLVPFMKISTLIILCTSLKPILPPPHPQTALSSSMAKLVENPQQMSTNFGNGVQSRVYLS